MTSLEASKHKMVCATTVAREVERARCLAWLAKLAESNSGCDCADFEFLRLAIESGLAVEPSL